MFNKIGQEKRGGEVWGYLKNIKVFTADGWAIQCLLDYSPSLF